MSETVKTSIADRVCTITIDNPPVNIISRVTLEALQRAAQKALADDAVKVIILTGSGSFAFVAGADVKEIAAINGAEDGRKLASLGQAVIQLFEDSPKPTIAAINALCIGGGNELAMACHIRIASERARFGQPEINLGIIPGFGGTQRLPRLVGLAKAYELTLTGDMISAQEAFQIGLLNKVVPPEEVMKHATNLAKKIAGKSLPAIRRSIEAIKLTRSCSMADGLAREAQLFGETCATNDMHEGVRAFLEKRQPKFQDS